MRYTRYRSLSGVSSQPLATRNALAPRGLVVDVPLAARGLSGLESQGLARTLNGPFAGQLGDDTAPLVDPEMLKSIAASQAAIKKQLDAQERQRKIALIIGIGSAIFAAARLGIIAFPVVREQIRRF